MWIEIVSAGLLTLDWVYHRFIEDQPKREKPVGEVSIPRVDEGAVVPLIYGRCRVRSPILTFTGVPTAEDTSDKLGPASPEAAAWPITYCMNMMFVLGTPFRNGLNRLHTMWVGDLQLVHLSTISLGFGTSALQDQTGDGGVGVDPVGSDDPSTFMGVLNTKWKDTGVLAGNVEFLNGKTNQSLIGTLPDTTHAGIEMSALTGDPNVIPDYRGYMCVFLWGNDNYFNQWMIGGQTQVHAYQFEASSYPNVDDTLFEQTVGLEANPIDVLRDLIVSEFNRLGFDVDRIHFGSFSTAALTVADEGLGYSRFIDDPRDARDYIAEIEQLTDGVFYEDPTDGKLHYRLVRDVSPVGLPHITVDNCEDLHDFSLGGWADVANQVRVIFSDRAERYQDNSAVARNQANAVGQDGLIREVVLRMPGICTLAEAQKIADRELLARSRPLAKCRAVVSRAFLRVVPGDAVKVTWPLLNIHGRVFRVARVGRGALQDNHIVLDLIEGFFA